MNTLRTRLFLNLAPFLVILLAIGIYGTVLFLRLANEVESVLLQNYRSEMAAHFMGLALAEMDKGISLVSEAKDDLGQRVFEENQALFAKNLAEQLRALASGNELRIPLQTNYDALLQAATSILRLPPTPEQRTIYEQQFLPSLEQLNLILEKVRRLDHDAIVAAARNIRASTEGAGRLMMVGLALALVLSGYACYKLSKSIVEPIYALTRATQELGNGNLDQIVPAISKDEVGELALSFNAMAAQLRTYRQSTTGKILHLHSITEATLASFPDPVFVLDREAHVELQNLAAAEVLSKLRLGDKLPDTLHAKVCEVLEKEQDFVAYDFAEAISIRAMGRERHYLPRILLMRNSRGGPLGVAVVLYDITRFQLIDDLKTNLLATVSHELKTPLTGVRLAVHILLEGTAGPLTPKQQELLSTARDDAERLLGVLDALLEVTRLTKANDEPPPTQARAKSEVKPALHSTT